MAIFNLRRIAQKNCLSLKEKVSEMRKKQNINLAGKKDLDRQVSEMKDLENHIKNQVMIARRYYDLKFYLLNPAETLKATFHRCSVWSWRLKVQAHEHISDQW